MIPISREAFRPNVNHRWLNEDVGTYDNSAIYGATIIDLGGSA